MDRKTGESGDPNILILISFVSGSLETVVGLFLPQTPRSGFGDGCGSVGFSLEFVFLFLEFVFLFLEFVGLFLQMTFLLLEFAGLFFEFAGLFFGVCGFVFWSLRVSFLSL